MTTSQCTKRLQREYRNIQKDPIPYCVVAPSPNNLLEWHYVLLPPIGSIYHGGEYHGRIKFPQQYPYKPPAIYMDTPSGRFITGKSICLSMSEYHPETWNPLWCVSSIVSGILSFMLESTRSTGTMESSNTLKRKYANDSSNFNNTDPLFRLLFSNHPTIIEHRKYNIERLIKEEENEIENIKQGKVQSYYRMRMLIITIILAILLAIISVIVQASMQKTK